MFLFKQLASKSLLLISITCLLTSISYSENVEIPLAIEKISGAVVSNGRIYLPTTHVQPSDGKALVIEAEEPVELHLEAKAFDNPQGFVDQDTLASGGAFLCNMEQVNYKLKITKSGKYQIWYRSSFPWQGGWCHTDGLDKEDLKSGGFIDDLRVQNDSMVNKWMWIKGPVYEMSAGDHTHIFGYLNGSKMDQIIYTTDFSYKPSSSAPIALSGTRSGPAEGVVLFKSIKPAALKQWIRIHDKSRPYGGSIFYEVSIDNGKTWTRLGADLNLSDVTKSAKSGTNLLCKAIIKPAADGRSPLLQGVTIVYATSTYAAAQPVWPKEIAAELWTSIPLQMQTVNGPVTVDIQGRLIPAATIYGLANSMAVIEAESGEKIHGPDGTLLIRDYHGASAGKAVYPQAYDPRFDRVSLRFWVAMPAGSYTIALRVKRDQNHQNRSAYISVDGQDIGLPEVPKEKEKNWNWVSMQIAPISGGVHKIELSASWNCASDQILITSDRSKVPANNQTLTSTQSTIAPYPQSITVVTSPVSLGSLADIQGIAGTGVDGASIEVSVDMGASWRPISSLSSNQNAGVVQFKLKMSGNSLKVNEPLPQLTLSLNKPLAPMRVVDQGSLKVYLDEKTGNLCGLYDAANKRWITSPGYSTDLFKIGYEVPGEFSLRPLKIKECQFAGASIINENSIRKLQLKYTALGGTIVFEPSFSLNEKVGSWSWNMSNNSQVMVRNVRFPDLDGVRVGPETNRSNLCEPTGFGRIEHGPNSSSILAAYFGYPGSMTMAWIDLFDNVGGLYLAAYDPEQWASTIATEKPSVNGDPLRLVITKHYTVMPGQSKGFTFKVWPHAGDWHVAGKEYRDYLATWRKPLPQPAWAKLADGWVPTPHGTGTRMPSRYVTHFLPRLEWIGMKYVSNWGGQGDAESCGYLPYLNPRYGTPSEQKQYHKEAREHGMRFAYYLNCQGWVDKYATDSMYIGMTKRKWFQADVNKWIEPAGFTREFAAKGIDGLPTTEGPGIVFSDQDRIMDISAPQWFNHLYNAMVNSYCKMYGTSGTYLDQAGCVYRLVWNRGESMYPNQQGCWGKAYTDLLKKIVIDARKINPEYIVNVEGMGDGLMQYANFGLYVGWSDGLTFQYCVPDARLCRGSSNGGGYYVFENHPKKVEMVIGQTSLFYRFELGGQSGCDHEWYRRSINVRQNIHDWMYNGCFEDDDGLKSSDARIQAKWFSRTDKDHKGAVINIWNPERLSGQKLTFSNAAISPRIAIRYNWDGSAEALPTAKTMNIPVTDAPFQSILIVEKSPESEALRLGTFTPFDSLGDRVVIAVVNTGTQSITAKLSVGNIEAAKPGSVIPDKITLGTGEVKTIVVPLTAVGSLKKLLYIAAKVTDGKTTATDTVVVFPPVLNTDFELDTYGRGVPNNWGSGAGEIHHGINEKAVDWAPPIMPDGERDTIVIASGKASLRLNARHFVAWRPLARVDSIVQHLWIDETQQTLILRPGKTYKVSVKIRTAADSGVVASVNGKRLNPVDKITPDAFVSYATTISIPSTVTDPSTIYFQNDSDKPAWFDDVIVEEVGGKK